MKKFFTLLLCLFLTVCLGCSSSQPAPVTWGEDDLSVTQVSSQSVISYGMTRSEIEQIVGEERGVSTASTTKDDSIYYGNLYVGYRDDMAAELVIESDTYRTAKGVTIGDTKEEVEKRCGETDYTRGTIIVGSTAYLMQYLFDQEGNLIPEDNIPDQITTSNDFYTVSFEFEKNRVVRMRICDARFSFSRT